MELGPDDKSLGTTNPYDAATEAYLMGGRDEDPIEEAVSDNTTAVSTHTRESVKQDADLDDYLMGGR